MVNGAKSTVVNAPPSVRRSGVSSMVRMRLDVVGDVDEVGRVLGRLGGRGGETVRIHDGRQIPAPGQGLAEAAPEPAAGSPAPPAVGWTEEMAADFMAGLGLVARRMTLCVWRAGNRDIHRSAL